MRERKRRRGLRNLRERCRHRARHANIQAVIEIEFTHDFYKRRDRPQVSLLQRFIGATQPATRTRMAGNDGDLYEYVVQLGPTLEDGPNLVVRTSSLMGGDYGLNRAILDRMMATMEFIGVIQ